MLIDAAELLVFTCASVPGPGPVPLESEDRGLRASWVVIAGLVTAVTAPMPLMFDFTTGSSLVLSRPSKSIGMGCEMKSDTMAEIVLLKTKTYQL